jgi:beta-ureidopropionase
LDVEVKSFKVNSHKEQNRPQRLVKVGAIQNKIVLPTDRPIAEQKAAIFARIK